MIKSILIISVLIFIISCTNPNNEVPKTPRFKMKKLSTEYDYLAPDSSEIRLLQSLTKGDLVHCTLPPGKVSIAVRHKTVEEIWYFIEGKGEVWRKQDDKEEVVVVEPGISLTIPLGTHFQFRNTGDKSLKFIICTMPPWPGEVEAVKVKKYW